MAAPFALYLLWYVTYGTNRAGFEELSLSALWAWTAANHAAGAIIGERQIEPGQQFLILLLVVFAYRVFRVERAAKIRMLALATILLTFYGLTAVSRHDIAPPSSSRYLTVGIVFLLLMLVEAARGWKIRTWVPFVVLLLVWVSFGKADGNADALRDGRILFLQRSENVRASLGAVELLGRDRVPPTFEIAPLAAPFLEAGPWFDTLDGLRGDPGYSPAQLARAPAGARTFADDTLVRAGGLALRPGGARPAACVPARRRDRPARGRARRGGRDAAADRARAPLRHGVEARRRLPGGARAGDRAAPGHRTPRRFPTPSRRRDPGGPAASAPEAPRRAVSDGAQPTTSLSDTLSTDVAMIDVSEARHGALAEHFSRKSVGAPTVRVSCIDSVVGVWRLLTMIVPVDECTGPPASSVHVPPSEPLAPSRACSGFVSPAKAVMTVFACTE